MTLMQQHHRIKLVIIVILCLLASAACTVQDMGTVTAQFLDSLTRIQKAAVEAEVAKLGDFEAQVDEIWKGQAMLEQVATPAKDWIALQLKRAESGGWARETSQVIEDLNKLSNARFRVVRLVFAVESARNYHSVIDILDSASGEVSSYESIKADLDNSEAATLQESKLSAERINLSTTALKAVIDSYASVEARKTGSYSYKVYGLLGLDAAAKITPGEWVYYTDSGRIEAVEDASLLMKKALACQYAP